MTFYSFLPGRRLLNKLQEGLDKKSVGVGHGSYLNLRNQNVLLGIKEGLPDSMLKVIAEFFVMIDEIIHLRLFDILQPSVC